MDKILDMISHWDKFGQFLFFLILAGMAVSGLCWGWFYLVVLFRGWPPPGSPTPKLPNM
jgi:hypothetical protein